MSIVFILIIIYIWKPDSNWELATITIYLVNWINKCALTKYTTEKSFLFFKCTCYSRQHLGIKIFKLKKKSSPMNKIHPKYENNCRSKLILLPVLYELFIKVLTKLWNCSASYKVDKNWFKIFLRALISYSSVIFWWPFWTV